MPNRIALAASLLVLFASPALAQPRIKVEGVGYDQHFNPGENVTFSVTVRNHEQTSQFAEVDVTLVSSSTGTEFTLTPVLTGTLAPRDARTFTRTYSLLSDGLVGGVRTPITAGTYTVSFPLFDGNGVKLEQVRGKYPLHVGTETESLRVFPEVIHLGTIPPGRFMHPMPIEVRWSFYRFNQLRLDPNFTIRLYTDNRPRYQGIPGALRQVSPAGLVSLDGRYTLPLKVWTLNFGPDVQLTGWDSALAGPPPVDEDDAWIGPPLIEGGRIATSTYGQVYEVARDAGNAAWVRVPDLTDMSANPVSWRRLIGQSPHDTRFASDSNPTGDFTLTSPFTLYLATDAGATAVEGSYAGTLVVELWDP